MSQAERIKQASQIKIGGSEDEAKEAVKQLFKKSTTAYTTATSKELDLKYEADLNRLAYLLDCDFEGTLKNGEEFELTSLEKEFKGVVVPALSDLIYETPTFRTTKEMNYYSILVQDLKMFEDFKTEAEAVKQSNKMFISSIRKELQDLRDNLYNQFNNFDCEDLF